MILLLLLVGRMVAVSAVECDFDNIVIENCNAVIINPIQLWQSTRLIQNVELELACDSGVDCIIISSHDVTMISTTITCTGSGAAGISLGSGLLHLDNVLMTGCNPAIRVHDSSAVLQVTRSLFQDNTRAIHVDIAELVLVEDSQFNGNFWSEAGDGEGGAALSVAEAGSITITGSNFTKNDVHGLGAGYFQGGAVNIEDSDKLIINTSQFIENNVNGYGGGIYISNTPTEINNAKFYINSALFGGGGMYIHHNEFSKISDCEFIENETTYVGGGMRVIFSANMEITGCHYNKNTARDGGGMEVYESINIEITGCRYDVNTAWYGGGMKVWSSDNILISGCHYDGNTARIRGGGMLQARGVTNITLTSTTGDGNKDDDIYCEYSTFYFDQQSYDDITNITEGYECVINV